MNSLLRSLVINLLPQVVMHALMSTACLCTSAKIFNLIIDKIFYFYINSLTLLCLPFVTMFTILKAEVAGLLLAPRLFPHTDTVPSLYCGRSVMVMRCSTVVKLLNSMLVVVALMMYLINERLASSADSHETCRI